MYVSLRDYLCTPYICVIKGLPVHHTSVSLRGYLYTPYVCVVKGLPLVCTPYICVIKGLLVHHTSVPLRGYLCKSYVCVVKGLPLYTLCMCCKGVTSIHLMYVLLRGYLLCVPHTSVSSRGYLYTIHRCGTSVYLMYVSLRGYLYTIHLCR